MNRLEILEMIKKNQLSIEEGMELIKHLGTQMVQDAPETPSFVDYYGMAWVKASGGTTAGTSITGNVLLFDTNENAGQAIHTRYKQAVGDVVLITPGSHFRQLGENRFEINPVSADDYGRLLEELQRQAKFPQTLLHVWSKEEFTGTESAVQSQMVLGINSLFLLSKALLVQKLQKKVEILYLHQTGRSGASPLYAAVGGFARTIRLENPLLSVRTVEFQALEDLLAAAAQATGLDDEQVELRYRNGERYVRQFQKIDPSATPERAVSIREQGVYVITGGVGGLGMIFAQHLARTCNAKLVLTGRSDFSSEIEAKVRKLEALGAQVRYIQADVSKRQDVDHLIAQAKHDFGVVNGVIHCAGTLRDGFVLKKTLAEVQEVVAPKVFGTLHLDYTTKDEPLDFFVLFASMAGVVGNVGQSDYAYANSFMDHFVAYRATQGRPGRRLAIDWPLWEEGGMQVDEGTKQWMKQTLGVVPLSSENGLRAFEFGLQSDETQIMVVEIEREEAKHTMNVVETNKSTSLGERDEAEFREKSEVYMKAIFANLIKLPAQQIDPREPLEAYGIDSMMIMALNRELESHFGSLSKTLLFEYPTITELTDYFVEHYQAKLMEKTGWNGQSQPEHVEQRDVLPQPTITEVKPVGTSVAVPNRTNRSRFATSGQVTTRPKPLTVTEQPLVTAHDEMMDDIAIIGVNGRFPQADDLAQFWNNLASETDSITEIPAERWNHSKYYSPDKDGQKAYSKWGGFINDVDKFDPLFFSISPLEAEQIDPQERLFLEVVHHAIEDAGYTKSALEKENVGVFVGVMYGHYQLYHTEWEGTLISPASSFASIANRISYCFNFSGPSIALDTMCSSSLTALHLAIESIRRGECSMAVAGGVNVSIHPIKYQHLSLRRFASSDGKCRTFGVGGDGYVPGEGIGAVILKSIRQAQADGDHIYGVIKGVSVNHGGKTNGYTVPNPKAQGNLISDVLKKSGIHPRTISYIEAHGTGTPLGDPIEITGLVKAFGEYTKDKQFCSIGSVKTNIGHLESAAGIAAIAKVLLQMKHKQLVPSLHSKELNPNIDFDNSPFYVQHELEEWKQPVVIENGVAKTYPRRAGISSFGAGGSNAHVLLEEYEAPVSAPEIEQPRLIVLSARKEVQLKEYAQKILTELESGRDDLRLLDLVYTLQVGREVLEERLAIVASDLEELKQSLRDYCAGKHNIDNTYLGTVRKKKGDATLIDGREGQEFLNVIINDRKISKLARLWVAGVNIDWELLYQGEEPRRVSLPGYPFVKERYWIPVVEVAAVTGRVVQERKLHPLVHRNTSTLREQRYDTTFDGFEFFVADHVVNNQKVLPGACYLEMARAAGQMAAEKPVVKLNHVVLAAPVTVEQGTQTVSIALYPKGEGVEFVIFSEQAGGEKTVHSQGTLLFADPNEGHMTEQIDLDAILNRCTDVRSSAEWYQTMREFGFQYGEGFQVIREIMGNRNEMLSRLELPGQVRGDFADEALHPSLLDGALQTVGGLMVETTEHGVGTYLPYSLGEVEIRGTLNESCYVYVVKQDSSSRNVIKFNIYMTDSSGRILVVIKDYSAREYKTPIVQNRVIDERSLLGLLQQIEDGTLDSDEVEKLMGEVGEAIYE